MRPVVAGIADKVGALRGVPDLAVGESWGDGEATGDRGETGDFPAADEEVGDLVHLGTELTTATEGQLVREGHRGAVG